MKSFLVAMLIISLWLGVPVLMWGSETMNLAIPSHPLPSYFWETVWVMALWTVAVPTLILTGGRR